MKTTTVGEIATLVGGQVEGDPQAAIDRIEPPEEAGDGAIAVLTGRKALASIAGCRASALVVPAGTEAPGRLLVRVAEPRRAFLALLELFAPGEERGPGLHPQSFVDPGAVVGEGTWVGPGAVVEAGARVGARVRVHPHVVVGAGARVGDDSVLFPGVVLYPGVTVGNRVRIHSGAVIGSDGFGYERDAQGVQRKVPQIGTVEIADDVEIGANSCVDRATIGATRIGAGTKIDNLVQVGHNAQVGEHCCVIGQAGLAGSVTVGRFSVLAGQCGISDHVKIAEGTVVGAQSGVPNDIGPGIWLGSPALLAKDARRIFPVLARLPELLRRLRELEEKVATLEGRGADGA
ncbi:MAG: UDP-3-O-(3-hydroxymyristoyl)glucosamine N-acyltransferase [Holophagales bacterium]|jgi:UDP-3-O-[3-hydroxymyristoyl] glucosamine N-acyltransferase|nr:UDP-3-O-(3-hydroxymyristoyl)glucosamine N-acyltransferase [Holophagales bacterium]MBK9968489.1 UDP-3-O-(3-hydroxymyristoyl)glucosamine N-acyltransferase [Holophagales bacterium]